MLFLQFFMKATQLEQMREDFVYIKTTRSAIEDKIEQLHEVRLNFMDYIFLPQQYHIECNFFFFFFNVQSSV